MLAMEGVISAEEIQEELIGKLKASDYVDMKMIGSKVSGGHLKFTGKATACFQLTLL